MWCTERARRTARPARGVPWRPGSDDDTRSCAMGELLARVSRRATRAQVHHVTPVLADRAGGRVAEVSRQVARDFGTLAPPIALHAPAPETLAASWVILRETLLAAGRTSRAAREMVAAVVSLGNTCPYCVEVHATLLGGLVRGSLARSVAEGRLVSVRDPALRAVAEWARDSATRPGPEPSPLSVPSEHGAELVGVAVTFQYLNRMVNIFLDRSPIPAAVPRAVRAGPDTPVESAAYFAVAEALANMSRHSGAHTGSVSMRHADGALTMVVADDGAGAADPTAGTGLRGIQRRLAAFDGTMALSSPPGGPTVITMELPCALSSPRITPSSATD